MISRIETFFFLILAILLSVTLAEEDVQEVEVEVDNQEFVVGITLYG